MISERNLAILMAAIMLSLPVTGCLGGPEAQEQIAVEDECEAPSIMEDCLLSEVRPQDCSLFEVYDNSMCREMIPPSQLDYGGASKIFHLGVEMDLLSPSFIGDGPEVWLVTPSLPDGLQIDAESGVISGTPRDLSPERVYTIVAYNQAGSTSIDLSIRITVEPPSSLSYQNNSVICTIGIICDTGKPMINGSLPMTWSSSPPLPEGIKLGYDGSIQGVATVEGSGNYNISVKNDGGSDTYEISITVLPQIPPSFTYQLSPVELRAGEQVYLAPNPSPILNLEWSAQPELPDGLNLDANGTITGSTSIVSGWESYQITASNSRGQSTTIIQIRVLQNPPSEIEYGATELLLRVGIPMEVISPLHTAGADTWTVSPPLPLGLTINSKSGNISGTPSSISERRAYTVTASNAGGHTTFEITLEVKIQAPYGIQWPSFEIALFVGEETHLSPTNEGPTIENWESEPPLPTGLSFMSDGTIVGQPEQRHDWTFHSIWANNSGGSLQQRIWISVLDIERDKLELTQGLGTVDYPGYASPVLPVGDAAFPIAVAGEDRVPVISGSHVGRGKMIGYGHESWVDLSSNDSALIFSLRAVEWVCGSNASVGLASGAGFDSFADELRSDGHSTVDAHPDDLGGIDCLIAEFWNGYDDADNQKLMQFILNGGGLIMGGHSWYWSYFNDNPAHDYPGNRISKTTGLLVSNNPTSKDVEFGWGHDTLMTLRNTLDALRHHVSGQDQISSQQAEAISMCLSPMVSFVPFDFPNFWGEMHEIVNQSGWTVIDAETGHEFGQDPLEDIFITIESGLVSIMPANLVTPHPSHQEFPGSVPQEAPRLTRNLTIDSNQTGLPAEFGPANPRAKILHTTGLYAPPGELVTLKLPGHLALSGVMVQVGAHDDELWHKEKIWRFPSIVRTYLIHNTTLEVSNAFGGPIFIASPPDSPIGQIWVEIEGAIEAPVYNYGQTSLAEWHDLRDNPAPWAEISSNQFILTVPSSEIRNLENPDELMEFWVQALEMEHDLYGYLPWPRIERAVFDIQISAGWMHSGYPFMAHLASADDAVDLDHLQSEGDWGMFHELGHNHQWNPSRLPGTTEATCNLASVYLMEELVGISGHSALTAEARDQRMGEYFQNGADITDWSVFTALDTYLIIKEEWGWSPITEALTVYYYLPDSEVPASDVEEYNAWVVYLSESTGYNLAPYHGAWGFPLTQSTAAQLLTYPVWVDDPIRGNYVVFDPILRNLTASSISESTVLVTWDVYDNGTDVEVTIFYGEVDHGQSETDWEYAQIAGTAVVGEEQYQLEGLDPSTTYYARLKSSNDNGDLWSDPITWTTSN
tara:strand:+ start:2374 stop:6348 length:3975 start_codon:yes stop_codon:yes gene_type:complete